MFRNDIKVQKSNVQDAYRGLFRLYIDLFKIVNAINDLKIEYNEYMGKLKGYWIKRSVYNKPLFSKVFIKSLSIYDNDGKRNISLI